MCVALGQGGGEIGADQGFSGVIRGVELRMGGVIGHVGFLSIRFFTSSSLLSDGAGEGARACGFAIGLGIVIAGLIGVGMGRGSLPINDGKLLSSSVTSWDR